MNEIVGGVSTPLRYNAADFQFRQEQAETADPGAIWATAAFAFSTVSTQARRTKTSWPCSSAQATSALWARDSVTACRHAAWRSTPTGPKEEFPRFTEFWLERPAADAKIVTCLCADGFRAHDRRLPLSTSRRVIARRPKCARGFSCAPGRFLSKRLASHR